MTRDATLPAGVGTAASQYGYRARHAVVIATPTPLRWCDGPTALLIGSDTYQPGAITPSSIALVGLPSITVQVPNTANEVSQPDAEGTVIKASLKVYEVHWSAAGAQLSPVPLFDGEVVSTNYEQAAADIGAKARTSGTAGMVGRPLGRLCHYTFGDGRCGPNVGAWPGTFTRATTAYKQDGTGVAISTPRYEAAKYSNGVTIEEGTINFLSADDSSFEGGVGNWITVGGTLTSDSGQHWSGTKSGKHVCTAIWHYIFTGNTTYAAAPGYSYSATFHNLAENGKTYQVTMRFVKADNTLLLDCSATPTGTGAWQTNKVSGVAPALTAYVQFFVVNSYNGAHTIYTDGVQCEVKAYPTSWHIGGGTRNAEVLTVPQAQVSNAAGTFEWWVNLLRAPGTNQQYLLDLNGAANHSLKFYVRTDGKLECVFGTGAADVTITGTNALAVDTLYHVAVTWGAAGITIYKGGSSEGTSATAPSLAAGTLVYLGSKADGTLQLDGIADDLRIEDNARSGTDIAADAASSSALAKTNHTLGKYALDSALTGSGKAATCDRRLETCTLYGNQLRFGGWPSMPQIGQKWSYTVANPQPLSDRSGTLASRTRVAQPPVVVTSPTFPRKKFGRA